MRKIKSICLCAGMACCLYVAAQVPPYKNPVLPVQERVKNLLKRMTQEEKFWQLFMISGEPGADSLKYRAGIFGLQVSAAAQNSGAAAQLLQYRTHEDALALAKKINSIQRYFVERTRLGIPVIAFDEALHGLVRGGATSFPQAIALAATWDTSLMHRVAAAIADETRARGIRQVLTPVVNIASDVRWGRTEETYGEDPFLASEMAVAFVQPFESRGIVTTPKHFVANVGDGGRDSYPIHYNERLLNEVFFPPFKAAIERGGARSVMTAYNSVDGSPATANDRLLNKYLKTDWQFKGFVISDASAVGGANVLHFTAKDYADAGKQAITNGLDVIFQTDYDHHRLFIAPFLDGEIDSARVDDAVARVLTVKFELGLFEHPYVPETPVTDMEQHRALAREAAARSIVLLRNEKQVLPISKQVRSIAVIGSDAKEARLGGYSGPGNSKVSIWDGILAKAGSQMSVSYAEGPGRHVTERESIPGKCFTNGLRGEYYDNVFLSGTPVLVRKDEKLDFHWTLYPPDTSLRSDSYAVRWTGRLKPLKSGSFRIGLEGNDGFRLYINDSLLVDQWDKQSFHTRLASYTFDKDHAYDIRVEFFEAAGNAHIRLVWDMENSTDYRQKIDEAVATAKRSDMAVIVAGIEEGEFRDRAMLSLPGMQEQLIREVAAVGKPVVVVLTGGSAITMQNWIDSADGILDVWYPGEMGGHAVADVLFGDVNPAGRLPVTFPLSEAQLPLVYNHKPTGRGDDYNNLSGLPLFPFGYGLSYTSFRYDHIQLDKRTMHRTDSAILSCTVTNTGRMAGDEVVQLYIRDVLASMARPVMELKGFRRIHLQPGESRKVSFTITPSLLEMFDENMNRVVEPGDFRLMIGSSSRSTWLKEAVRVVDKLTNSY